MADQPKKEFKDLFWTAKVSRITDELKTFQKVNRL